MVDELYGLEPDRFVGARNARVRELRAAGDRQGADALRRLSRPSAAAWAANLVVRSEPSAVEELLHVGSRLRRAQRQGSGDDIRALSAHRRDLVQRLVAVGSDQARAAGHPLAAGARRQLADTLEAAVADEGAGRALRAGRLEDSMSHVGFGDVALGPPSKRAAHGRTRVEEAPAASGRRAHPGTPSAARRARARAEAEVRRARAALEKADAALGDARRRHREAQVAHQRAARELGVAGRQLDKAADSIAKAEQARVRAQDALAAARAAAKPPD